MIGSRGGGSFLLLFISLSVFFDLLLWVIGALARVLFSRGCSCPRNISPLRGDFYLVAKDGGIGPSGKRDLREFIQ